MPNMFGGPQDHPEYTGIEPRARSRRESVSKGIVYRLVGELVEREALNGAIERFTLDSECLPVRVRNRFRKTLELQKARRKK